MLSVLGLRELIAAIVVPSRDNISGEEPASRAGSTACASRGSLHVFMRFSKGWVLFCERREVPASLVMKLQ